MTDRADRRPIQTAALTVRDLRADELATGVQLLSRAMRDNPIHVAAYGDDADRRQRCHLKLMRALFATFTAQQPIAALDGDTLVGMTGTAPAGTCQASVGQRLRMTPALLGLGPRTAARIGTWIATWAENDLAEPHVHLGPLGVDAHLQGNGIGSQILHEHVRRLDHSGQVGYLETDKAENVVLYERFGYLVIKEQPVLGVPNWFMRRPVRS